MVHDHDPVALAARCAAEAAADPATAALSLRIAAVFIICAASAIGVFLPLALSRSRPFARGRVSFFVLKAFGAGVILATGLVHMMPASLEALGNECAGWPGDEFPWTGTIMTATMIVVLAIEHAISSAVEVRMHKRLRSLARGGATATTPPGAKIHTHEHGHTLLTKGNGAAAADPEAGHRHRATPASPHTDACCPPSPVARDGVACAASDLSLAVVHGVGPAHGHGHTHQHSSAGEEAGDTAALTPCPTAVRHKALAQVLELGIGLHSVLIGIALGVARDAGSARALLIAISFHQAFEGVALGGCLIEAEYSTRAYTAMAAAYSMMTPVGVAIGIGIRTAYNPSSSTALGVTGAFDAVAAGILVYMALVDLVAVDFMSARFRADGKLQASGYGGLVVGAAAMTVLALWA